MNKAEQKQILIAKREEMYQVLKEKDLSGLSVKELKETLALLDILKNDIKEPPSGWESFG